MARAGAWLVGAYVAVALVTTLWAPGAMRPLFDGFGSHPGEYLWVDPPRRYAEGNRPPEKASVTVRLAADGSAPGTASPPDGQALAQLQARSVPAHPPDESARVDLEPLAAGAVAPLPAGLKAVGNAYRVTITYEPSGTAVERLEVPGTVGLTSAEPPTALLYSRDGGAWERRDGRPLARNDGLTGVLEGPGHYLAAAEGSPDGASGGGVPVIVYVVGAAVPLGLAWLLLAGRDRGRVPARAGKGKARPGDRRRPASGSKGRTPPRKRRPRPNRRR